MTAAGFDFLQLLPLNEMAEGQNSPYSALSAMAIDPIFIAPAKVPELEGFGAESFLDAVERERLEAVRAGAGDRVRDDPRAEDPRVPRGLRPVPHRRVASAHAARDSVSQAFIERERWWLSEYTLFRALCAREGTTRWREWRAGVPRSRARRPR